MYVLSVLPLFFKRERTDTLYNMDEHQKHTESMSETSDIKGHILHDSISMTCPEHADPQGWRTDWWVPGAWRVTANGDGGFFFFFLFKYFFLNILLFSLLFSFFSGAKQHVGS